MRFKLKHQERICFGKDRKGNSGSVCLLQVLNGLPTCIYYVCYIRAHLTAVVDYGNMPYLQELILQNSFFSYVSSCYVCWKHL